MASDSVLIFVVLCFFFGPLLHIGKDIPADAIEGTAVFDDVQAVRDEADVVAMIDLLDLLDGHLVFFDSQSRNEDFSIDLQEVNVGPVDLQVLVGAVAQFLNGEILRQGCFNLLSQLRVEIGIVIQQDSIAVNPADHSIGVAIAVIFVSWNQDNLRLEVILQLPEHILVEAHWILVDDLVCHNDLIATLDYVAAVQDNVGADAFQPQFFADGPVIRYEIFETMQVVRVIGIQ